MALKKCLISVTIPGNYMDSKEHPVILAFVEALKSKGVYGKFVDIIAGWGSLTQNWFEFETEVDTDWDWVRLTCFTDEEWYGANHEFIQEMSGWRSFFLTGQMLMMVHYVDENSDGEKVYTPHH